jgi:hypothetical protein
MLTHASTPASIKRDKYVLWAMLLCSAISLAIALAFTPNAIIEIQEQTLLNDTGILTTGKVVGHAKRVKKRRCRSEADIEYIVNGTHYVIQIQGCGARPEKLALGQTVEIRYLADAPNIAMGIADDAVTNRFSWTSLLTLWGLVLLVAGGTVALFMKFKNRRET